MPEDKTEKVKKSLQSFWHKLAVGDEQNPAWLKTFWQKLTVGDEEHKPWASNPIVVVLSLLFSFPVGVWFLFWFTNWNKQVKWSLFAFCGLVFLFRMSGVDMDEVREEGRKAQRLAEIRQAAEAEVEAKAEAAEAEANKLPENSYMVKGIRINNNAHEELKLENFSVDGISIWFNATWHHKLAGYPNTDRWIWSAYDKDDVKIDGGAIDIPSMVETHQKFKARIICSEIEEAHHIKIHF